MTRVRFLERDGMLLGYEVSGHAGYAQKGEDIVCAAVSALTQTALIGLSEVVKAPVDWSVDEKKARLSARVLKSSEGAQLILRTLEAGLRSIAEQYPDLVGIDYMQRR